MKISPSQLKSARCIRKWAAQKLAHLDSPPGKAAQLGTAAHKQLELYIETGREPDDTKAGQLAREAIPFLPRPRGELDAEARFSFVHDELGVILNGIKDFSAAGVLGDLKTTSNPEANALTEETIRKDEQAVVYALAGFLDDPTLEEIELVWIYVRTVKDANKKKAFPVTGKFTREEAFAAFSELLAPRILEMKAARAYYEAQAQSVPDIKVRLNMLPNDPVACDGVGTWCPAAEFCDMYGKNTGVTMGLIEKRKAALAEKKGGGGDVQSKLAALKAKRNAESMAPPEADVKLEETAKEIVNDPTDPPEDPNADTAADVKEKVKSKRKAKAATPAETGDNLAAALQAAKAAAVAAGFELEVRLK